MRLAATVLGTFLVVAASAVQASDFSSTGPGSATIVPAGSDDCYGVYTHNHDGTFENGYCWQYGAIAPPYCGAFGEGFASPGNQLACVSIYLTGVGFYGEPLDIYVWDGGVSSPPGEVLTMFPDQLPYNIPFWPSVGENLFEVYGYAPPSGVTVGYWADFSAGPCFFVAADENGYGGHPWTNMAPGIGYPTGWHHPNLVWPECRSLGFGIYSLNFSPVESSTWGMIKELYRSR